MPDGAQTVSSSSNDASFARHDRAAAIAFVGGAQIETTLRDGLSEWLPHMEIRRGGIRAAIAAQQAAASPRILIVDVCDEEDKLAALGQLSDVVEPDTCVLVIGDVSDLTLYREITRGLGAAEYLALPLTRDLVRRHFGPLVRGQAPEPERGFGGRLITVTGARGGVGASVIAASLAWHLGAERRHTVLLDADLTRGTAALMLDTDPGAGLRTALKAPERIDALLAERAAQLAADRVHVLAAGDAIDEITEYASGACEHLLSALRRRYNVIVADVPWNADPFCRDLLTAAQQRLVVLTPTLPSVRDSLRLMALPGTGGARVPTSLVLNRSNMQGGLKRAQLEEALRHPVDVVIPDLPRQVAQSVTLGQRIEAAPFRKGIAEMANQIGVLQQPGHPSPAARPGRRWRFFGRR